MFIHIDWIVGPEGAGSTRRFDEPSFLFERSAGTHCGFATGTDWLSQYLMQKAVRENIEADTRRTNAETKIIERFNKGNDVPRIRFNGIMNWPLITRLD